jgi:hypothetical protein
MSKQFVELKADKKVNELLDKYSVSDAIINAKQALYLVEELGKLNIKDYRLKYEVWQRVYEKLNALENERFNR